MGVLDDGTTGIIPTLCHLHTGIAKAPLCNHYSQSSAGKVPIGAGISLADNGKVADYRQCISQPAVKYTCIRHQYLLLRDFQIRSYNRKTIRL
jgi:hypothetical protein